MFFWRFFASFLFFFNDLLAFSEKTSFSSIFGDFLYVFWIFALCGCQCWRLCACRAPSWKAAVQRPRWRVRSDCSDHCTEPAWQLSSGTFHSMWILAQRVLHCAAARLTQPLSFDDSRYPWSGGFAVVLEDSAKSETETPLQYYTSFSILDTIETHPKTQ